jgi:hypothetical protein
VHDPTLIMTEETVSVRRIPQVCLHLVGANAFIKIRRRISEEPLCTMHHQHANEYLLSTGYKTSKVRTQDMEDQACRSWYMSGKS